MTTMVDDHDYDDDWGNYDDGYDESLDLKFC